MTSREKKIVTMRWYGIILMAFAAALFPVKDGFIKFLSGTVSAIEAGMMYFLVQAIMALLWILYNKSTQGTLLIRKFLSPLFFLRTGFQVLSLVLFFFSIQHAPIADAVVIFSSNSIFLVFISFFFLGEKKSVKIVFVSILGFVGVLVVLSPNITGNLNVYLWFSLASAIAFAVYLSMTKLLGQFHSAAKMLFFDGIFGSTMCLVVAIGLGHFFDFKLGVLDVNPMGLSLLLGAGVIGTFSSLLVIVALRYAPASILAPVGYIEIVSASIIGIFIFNEQIHTYTIVGCAIIVFSTWMNKKLQISDENLT